MQFIVLNDTIECPLCSMILVRAEHKHEVAAYVTHHNPKCPWAGDTFRVHPKTGYAEKVAHP
jgi:hypothetical protein